MISNASGCSLLVLLILLLLVDPPIYPNTSHPAKAIPARRRCCSNCGTLLESHLPAIANTANQIAAVMEWFAPPWQTVATQLAFPGPNLLVHAQP